MLDLEKLKGFEWDRGNIDKSYEKHGVTSKDAERAFLDKKAVLQEDLKHAQTEERYIIIGKIERDKILFVVFTVRNKRIRIVSARRASKKERREYEKI